MRAVLEDAADTAQAVADEASSPDPSARAAGPTPAPAPAPQEEDARAFRSLRREHMLLGKTLAQVQTCPVCDLLTAEELDKFDSLFDADSLSAMRTHCECPGRCGRDHALLRVFKVGMKLFDGRLTCPDTWVTGHFKGGPEGARHRRRAGPFRPVGLRCSTLGAPLTRSPRRCGSRSQRSW